MDEKKSESILTYKGIGRRKRIRTYGWMKSSRNVKEEKKERKDWRKRSIKRGKWNIRNK